MERLTDKMLTEACNDPWDYCGLDAHCTRHCTQPTPCKIPALVHRLAKIENILGDNYDLDRLRELVEADNDGRCVVLPDGGYEDKDGENALKKEENMVKELYRLALFTYGAQAQTMMVMEEMAELQKELCKHARGKENRAQIAEEIADVQIMLEQMELLHGCAGLVAGFKAQKLDRLEKRLREG